jgi:hypothetical protein
MTTEVAAHAVQWRDAWHVPDWALSLCSVPVTDLSNALDVQEAQGHSLTVSGALVQPGADHPMHAEAAQGSSLASRRSMPAAHSHSRSFDAAPGSPLPRRTVSSASEPGQQVPGVSARADTPPYLILRT